MIALDTNVLVRVLTRDDPEQAALAAEVMKSDDLFVCKTVLLELEWVLRFAYRFGRPAIAHALRHLLGLSRLLVEDDKAVVSSLAAYEAGMDFADALHLSSSAQGVTELATFDRAFARTAASAEIRPRVHLLAVG